MTTIIIIAVVFFALIAFSAIFGKEEPYETYKIPDKDEATDATSSQADSIEMPDNMSRLFAQGFIKIDKTEPIKNVRNYYLKEQETAEAYRKYHKKRGTMIYVSIFFAMCLSIFFLPSLCYRLRVPILCPLMFNLLFPSSAQDVFLLLTLPISLGIFFFVVGSLTGKSYEKWRLRVACLERAYSQVEEFFRRLETAEYISGQDKDDLEEMLEADEEIADTIAYLFLDQDKEIVRREFENLRSILQDRSFVAKSSQSTA